MSAIGSVRLRDIVKTHGPVVALESLNLDIEPGEFFALLGPSGSGKTTTLRIVAGLEQADRGTVAIDGRDVTRLQPGDRDVAMVFQSYALYPHMTVAQNIGFTLRMVGTPRAQIERAVREAAARVKIDHLLDRRPGQLSGGQQQRVALARAIVREPRLFLLDEPLSNLDAKLRVETRVELKKLQRALDVTTIYVTHDQEEAMTIADRMAIFIEGRLMQVGTPEAVFERPDSVAVASFLGNPPMNLVPGELDGRTLVVDGHHITLPHDHAGGARPVTVGIRPGDVRIDGEGLPASVYLTELLGETTIVNLRFGEQLIKARLLEKRHLREGDEVRISFNLPNVHLFDSASGERIALA
ncbi:MAG TPA: ABC transporter ATP-binding protein [Geminicoccaceae bacterium]|nr:ABC transporter ATP-binding protein [Geminicoccaceae bacterium]